LRSRQADIKAFKLCIRTLNKTQIVTEQGIFTAQVIGSRGDWVVCWPSQFNDCDALADFALMLSRDYRVVLCDPPSMGVNAHLPYTNQVNELVHYGHLVLKRMGIERCHWVGHGAGGVIGAALHSALPGCMQSLTLVATPMLSQGRLKVHLAASTSLLAGSRLGRRLISARTVNDLGYANSHEKELLGRYISGILERTSPKVIASLRPLDGGSVRRVFERLRVAPPPTLIFCGEKDNIVLPRDQRTVAEILQAQFVSLRCGHVCLMVEPEACAHAFLRFMQRLGHHDNRAAFVDSRAA
jgi:pimeloyl-ACP methyl ester carboxylesterase